MDVNTNTAMTSTAVEGDNEIDNSPDASVKPGSAKMWKTRIDKCKNRRRNLIDAWADNVEYRRGKPFQTESDQDRINVNLDWSITKAKHANLFSQTPQVYLTAKRKEFKKAMAPFAKELNDKLTAAEMGAACDEAVIDAINASGFGVVFVGYQATTELKDLPEQDISGLPPEQQLAMLQAKQVPTTPTPQVIDSRYYVKRLSPSDFLWPHDFTGSNFDDADWLGRSGTMLWSEAKREFNLNDAQKDDIVSAKGAIANLRSGGYGSNDPYSTSDELVVTYDEIYYWSYRFNEGEKYFKRIYRIVFIDGIKDPVIHEPWNGQVWDEINGTYVGACKFPLRVVTFTYVSDDAIPPSDSAIIRPQIEEMIKSRSQMIWQRDASRPMRWINVNMGDPLVIDAIMRGDWQGIYPTNGPGDKFMGEIARSAYPPEDFAFDKIIKGDIQEQTNTGSNQMGTFATGERSAREVGIIERNFQARVGYERAKVGKLVVQIAEVMAGLLALNGDFDVLGQDEIQAMDATWDRRSIAGEYTYYIRPDSTVLLDSDQRIDRLMKYLNMVGKSGYVNPLPIIEEITALTGLDPSDVLMQPQPPAPDQPKLAFSFKGEDLINPVAIAILMRAGQAPQPQELAAAKNLLQAAGIVIPIAAVPNPSVPVNGAAPAPVVPGQVPPVAGESPPVGPQMTPGQDMRPGWTPANRVTKRVDEIGG